ncbi:MAG TPA: transglycosylase SLT domain-containing protein [Candidatus Binatia bacterium]
MRFPIQAVIGLAFVLAIAGCAAKQHPGTDLERWSLETLSPAATQQTPYGQYGLSVNPDQAPAKTAGSQFNFSHPRVDDFVAKFQTNLRGFYRRALSRSGRYVPQMSSILQKNGVPQELAYLPLIESGYSTHAVSPAGAAGPWQFIPGTGRRYGLRIDRYVDERRDPVKSTQAAAQYLKDLHDMFGDWHLSIAAYNTGEQNIVRILERRRIESFWEMSERGYLHQETCDYVPEFLAALQIAEAPEAYGFDASNETPLRYDVVKVARSLPLSTVAQLSGTSTSEIKELNPALHRDMIPPNGYAIRLPKGTKETFEVALASFKSTPVTHAPTRKARRSGGARGKHRVRSGETVASIAKQHRVSVSGLLKANGMRNPRNLQAGRTLRIHGTVARQEQGPVLVAKHKGGSRVLD